MFKNIARAISGDPQRKDLDKFASLVSAVNALESAFEALSDDALRAKTDSFRQRLAGGESLDALLPEAFAAVREASKRTTGLRHFDVQLIGGAALHAGRIAEMRTGEGKTLVATLPLYLNALEGKGAHLVTVNDYLARRDARWMAPIYALLGMSVGVLQMSARGEDARSAFLVDLSASHAREDQHQLKQVPRRDAYLADITYGTNNEFGFDYLRDNLVMNLDDRVQRGHHYAIVDEVDNILIDEARTPLIISGPASEDVGMYATLAQVVRALNPEDYEINEKDRAVSLTEIGIAHAEELLQTPLSDPNDPEKFNPEQERLLGYMEQALKAQHLFKKNKDYIVQNNQIVIVDEFTGRLMPGRRWSEGLHQAVEAKEGVKVNPENVTYATITLQNYFRKYAKLAGMTGTALTEAEEFATIYKLDVLSMPTNLEYIAARPDTSLNAYQAKDEEGYTYTYYAQKEGEAPLFFKRKDYPDVVYRTEEAKLRAICAEILRFHVLGRPQLVGTTSIEHSEKLSARLGAEPLRRLAVTLFIRQAWMEKHGQTFIERAVPELEFLNQPLNTLKPQELRQAAQNEGLAGSNPEDEANQRVLLRALNLDEAHLPRLAQAMQGGIPHQVLNALKHDLEGQIIASAGAFGAVTIATNMAGRGVDIKLGGSLTEDTLSAVRAIVRNAGREPYGLNNEELRAALDELPAAALEEEAEAVQAFRTYLDNMRLVREAGGLHVIGSERHEARRIDNQLRGRAARQGDPGSSRFYLSLEDELMRLFGGERVEALMGMFKMDASVPLESRMLGRLVEQAQERVEGANFDIRKHLLEYDDVLNAQRERIYGQRDRALAKPDLEEDVREMLHSELERRIPESFADPEGPWKLLAFLEEIQPSMFLEKPAARVPSYNLLLAREELRERLQKGKKPLKETLLELAGTAVRAEGEHLANSVRAFLDRTAETLEQQVAERVDTLDAFWDGLADREGADAQPRALLEELNALLRVRLNLTSEQTRALPGGSSELKDAIAEQVESAVVHNILTRAAVSVEKRAGEPLNLPLAELSRAAWPAVEDAFMNALDAIYDRRASQYSAANGPLAESIAAILKRQADAGLAEPEELELLAGMAIGQRVGIDARTRQRVMRRVALFSYLFLSARRLENEDASVVTERIITHLEAVRAQLRALWGTLELDRASDMAVLPMMAEPALRALLVEKLGSARFDELQREPFGGWPEDARALAAEVFGGFIQNRIYRQILLSAISDRWVEHLTRMEGLRVSIRMEAYAQRDPLVQYKSVSSDAFSELLSEVRMGVISNIFRVQPVRQAPAQTGASPATSPAQRAPAAQPAESKPQSGGKKHKKRRRH